MKKIIIYCDESVSKGAYYSNFYGGALLEETDYDLISSQLNKKKEELNLFQEIKWTKVTAQYLDKYIEFINFYFNFIKSEKIKIRIMFRNNKYKAQHLSKYQELNGFYLLYYQFIKHAFGLSYCNDNKEEDIFLKTYFDKLPNTTKQNELFKDFIYRLQDVEIFKRAHIKINREDITDIDSKKHVILQGMDIILGSMQYKLNKENLVINPQTGKRGKKTIAKEKLYREINRNIREIYPNFNIGISTGYKNDISNIWKHPYRHWSFIPASYEKDTSEF